MFTTTATTGSLNSAAVAAYLDANRAERTDNPTTFTHEGTTYTVAFSHHSYTGETNVNNVLSVTAN